MAITFRAIGASASSDAAGNLTLSAPAGLTNGDMLLAVIQTGGDGVTITPPAGWRLIIRQDTTADGVVAYWKRAAGEGANWTWTYTPTASPRPRGAVAAYYDSGGTTDVAPADSTGGATGTTSVICPSVTAPAAGLLIAAAGMYRSGQAPTIVPPAGMTERLSYGTADGYGVGYSELAVGAGATAAKTYGNTSGNYAAGISLVLYVPQPRNRGILRPVQQPIPVHHLQ